MTAPSVPVRARVTAFIGLPDGVEYRIESGVEYPADHPLVLACPELFLVPPDVVTVPEGIDPPVDMPPPGPPAGPAVDEPPVDALPVDEPPAAAPPLAVAAAPARRTRRRVGPAGQADG